MKVIKPLSLGVLFRPYTHRRRHRLAVTALGFFPLGATEDAFVTENVQWPRVMAALPPGELLDAAMPKARGEVLLSGVAHARGGQPVAAMEVQVSVGEVHKRLRVIGDRRWSYGLLPLHQVTAPEPFTVMPLTYDRAYGGPGFADNPTGQGYTGSRLGALAGRNEGRMPNLEYPEQPIRSHCGAYAPAGFGPLDLRWRQRQKKAGTYDARWLAEGFPGLADDIDFAVFNAAPEDQQFDGFFRGGEAYRLEGFHPAGAIEGRVPAMRVRALVQRAGRPPEQAEEIPMAMETIWLLPEAELGVAIFRGSAETADSDAGDIPALLLACERTAQSPRPVAHYREAFALRLDPEAAPGHLLNEAPLTPEKTAEEQARLRAEDAAAEAEEAAAIAARVKGAMADFAARSGLAVPSKPPAVLGQPPLLGPVPTAALRRGDADLSGLLARARGVAEEARRDGEARLAAARKRLSALGESAPPDAERLKAEAEQRARGAVPQLEPAPEPGGANTLDPSQARALREAREALPRLRAEARRVAPEPQSPPPPRAVAEHLGVLVRQWIAEGRSLAGRDLTGADLAGVDLHGADLRGTIFEQADFTGARLRGADLGEAVLTAATLTGADLDQANLRQANLCRAKARGALLRGACLADATALEADFAHADFTAADFTGINAVRACLDGGVLDQAVLIDALLLEASAEGARLRGAHLRRAVFYGARLARADLSGAQVERCVFTAVAAAHSVWRGARLRDTHLGHRSSFSGADLRAVDAAGCGWRGADLGGADLRDGIFAESDLGECRFDAARLDGALLARSVLGGASLRACSARRADLYQALCRKSDFTGADLGAANLYGASLAEAQLGDARLAGLFHSRQREVAP